MGTFPGGRAKQRLLALGMAARAMLRVWGAHVVTSQLLDCEEGGRQRVFTRAGNSLSALAELLLGSGSGSSRAASASSADTR